MAANNARSRAWIWTLNNWTADEEKYLKDDRAQQDACKFIVWGREVAPTTGTAHLQGFIYFKTGKTFAAVKKWFNIARIHLESKSARSTFDDCIKYCCKDGDAWMAGDKPLDQVDKHALAREKFRTAIRLAEENKMDELKEVDPSSFLCHYSALVRIRAARLEMPKDLERTSGIWISGKSGAGKSYFARSMLAGEPFYPKHPNKWWDGYRGERAVIIDDVDAESCQYLHRFFKIWLDKYAFTAEIKGGTIAARPQYIIVTSQFTVRECFKQEATIEAIERRLIYDFSGYDYHTSPFVAGKLRFDVIANEEVIDLVSEEEN